jgi:CRISPR-associated protein Cas4
MNGTLMNYFIHCKRQCYLHGNKLNLEDNSEEVKIGKAIHEARLDGSNNGEIAIDNIVIDKLSREYVTEIKKSDADEEATKWQLIYYLYILKQKGLYRKAKAEYVENNKSNRKTVYYELTQENEQELLNYIDEIDALLNSETVPQPVVTKRCKKCAYYEYCYI